MYCGFRMHSPSSAHDAHRGLAATPPPPDADPSMVRLPASAATCSRTRFISSAASCCRCATRLRLVSMVACRCRPGSALLSARRAAMATRSAAAGSGAGSVLVCISAFSWPAAPTESSSTRSTSSAGSRGALGADMRRVAACAHHIRNF
eukprot:scaffold12372_cov101-Isochrysis_galbana.AAC.2